MPSDVMGADDVDEEIIEAGEVEEAAPSPPPTDDDPDDTSSLAELASELVDNEADEDGDEQPRNDLGQYASREAKAAGSDTEGAPETGDRPGDSDGAEDGAEPSKGDDVQPEHLAEWTPEQHTALAQLPPETQTLVREPERFVEAIQNEVVGQVSPFIEAMQPFADVFAQQEVGGYIDRRAAELNIPPQDVVANVLKADAILTYSSNPEDRNAAAMSLLEQWGINPVDLAFGADPAESDQVRSLQQQLANERWERQQTDRRMQTQATGQHTGTIAQFTAATGDDGQPAYPLMAVAAVKASMADLIESGHAHSLPQAYEMAAAPINREIETRSRKMATAEAARLSKSEADRRATAVSKARRAGPVKVGTSSQGAIKTDETLEDIANDLVSSL